MTIFNNTLKDTHTFQIISAVRFYRQHTSTSGFTVSKYTATILKREVKKTNYCISILCSLAFVQIYFFHISWKSVMCLNVPPLARDIHTDRHTDKVTHSKSVSIYIFLNGAAALNCGNGSAERRLNTERSSKCFN